MLTRREWLRYALTSVAGTTYLPKLSLGGEAVLSKSIRTALSDKLFSLGIASGMPSADKVILWTRLIPLENLPCEASIPVICEIANDEQFSSIQQRIETEAFSALGYAIHAEAKGLPSDRWYFYRFRCGDIISPIGRTRTLPEKNADVSKLRLGYASCQRWEHGYFHALRALSQESVDLILFLGDYIYEYSHKALSEDIVRTTGGSLSSLNDYRARYALYKSDPDLQAAHSACPWYLTWDDHEVENDYAGEYPGNSGYPNFPERRAAAYQAFYEHQPISLASIIPSVTADKPFLFSATPPRTELRLYQNLRYGRLANINLLDCRQYRSRQVCNPKNAYGSSTLNAKQCPSWNDPNRSLLGLEQEAWLNRQLTSEGTSRDPAVWQIIAQSTLFGDRRWQKKDETYYWNDGWDGYAVARLRMVELLQKVKNPVMLGGDVHENWVGHIKQDYENPDSPNVGIEFCGTSITSNSTTNSATRKTALVNNPHFIFEDGAHRGYGIIDIRPQSLDTRLRVVENVKRTDGGAVRTLAHFHVEAGRLAVERVA